MFKANSSACLKDNKFVFQNIDKNKIADKAQIRYLKYILLLMRGLLEGRFSRFTTL